MFKHSCGYKRYTGNAAKEQWLSIRISRRSNTWREAKSLDCFIQLLYKLDLSDYTGHTLGSTAVKHICNYCGYTTYTGMRL